VFTCYSDTSTSSIFLVIPYLLPICSSNTDRRLLDHLEVDTVTFCPAAYVSYSVNRTVFVKNVYKPHVYSAFINPVRQCISFSLLVLELAVVASYSESETGDFVHSGKYEYKYRTWVTVFAFVSVTVHYNGFLRTAQACCLVCNGLSEFIFSLKIFKCFVLSCINRFWFIRVSKSSKYFALWNNVFGTTAKYPWMLHVVRILNLKDQ